MAKRQTTSTRQPAERAAFLNAITDNPADDTPRLVYADWLEEHDDPDRAAFIRAQVTLARLPTGDRQAPELAETAARLLKEHKWEWLAELGVKLDDAQFRRGFPQLVRMTAGGFLHYGKRLLTSTPVAGVALTNLGDRACRLAASPLLARLTSLWLSDETADIVRRRDVTPLFASPHVAGLRRLTLRSGVEGAFAVLAASDRLAGLQVLDLSWAFPDLGCLEDEAAAPGLGSLVALNLENNYLGDDAARVLAESPHLPRLRQLGLYGNELTDEGALALARPDAVWRLRYLDVAGNMIGDRGLRALARRKGLETLVVFGNRPASNAALLAAEREVSTPDWDWVSWS